MKRIVTGIILGAAVIATVLWGPVYLLVSAQVLFTIGGLWEFFRLSERAGAKALAAAGYPVAVMVSLLALTDSLAVKILGGLAFLAMIWMAATLLPDMDRLRLLHSSIFATILAVLYVAVPLMLLVWVCRQPDGRFFALFTLVVVWVGDTAGYFIGKNFGKHKSSPRISPHKTWEGTIASFLAALMVGFITAKYFWGGTGILEPIVLAGLLNGAAQMGDLAESGLKRTVGVKDSSHLVPGHGGVLDRIDALLFAAPVLWYYWLWHTG
jgi:phosphatidate cytidylyltransferase